MNSKILICNAGSTSLKLKLFDMPMETVLAYIKIDRIGHSGTSKLTFWDAEQRQEKTWELPSISDHLTSIELSLPYIVGDNRPIKKLQDLCIIGFKTVLAFNHTGVCELTDEVLSDMKTAEVVAPLHNKIYLEAIDAFKRLCPEAVLMCAFETGFHSKRPLYSRVYGVPYHWYQLGIQKYGFHGASHGYVADKMREIKKKDMRLISCHLGGSSSVCAIANGKCIDISSGFSPQTGLPHANRTGDLDAYAILHLLNFGMDLNEIKSGLNGHGGLLGISGISGDMRDLESAANQGNDFARLAINTLVYYIIKYVGAYTVLLGGLDLLVFTGGIGENSELVRREVCSHLSCLGIQIDLDANVNTKTDSLISGSNSSAEVWVIHTNEELKVARMIYEEIK